MAVKSRLAQGAIVLALACALLLAVEGAIRVAGRVRAGAWPESRQTRFDADIREVRSAYRRHPFLGVAPREGAAVEAFGKRLAFNRLGYRSPERPLDKPPGVTRVLCAGGSTTLDLHAATNEATWPWRLEERLRSQGLPVEVWNAGFNGWTSLENTVSLAIRDLDLEPDAIVLFQGLNDLQPAAQRPFDRQYERHAAVLARSLGFRLPPPRWWQRSLLYEWARDRAYGREDPWRRLATPAELHPAIAAEGVATFRRNVRSFLALARERGVPVLLATQAVRVREGARAADRSWLENWTFLEADAVPRELERLNRVLRAEAADDGAHLADWAGEALDDAHFADPAHFSAAGSEAMAAFVARGLRDSGLVP